MKGIIGGGAIIDPTTIEILNKKLPNVRLIQVFQNWFASVTWCVNFKLSWQSYGMTESLAIVNTEIMNSGDKRISVKISENQGKIFGMF